MDVPGDLLNPFRLALAPFDDEALAALANKGLVRRARKDLESGPPSIIGPDGGRLRLEVDDASVCVARTPSQSTCSCPASGICRHILTALIFLRESSASEAEPTSSPPEDASSPADEMRAVADEMLTKWAGKAMVARVARALGLGLTVEFEEAGALIARLPTRNVSCRWMPGGGLAGMVCSCHSVDACEHKVAAVLALQVAGGQRVLEALDLATLEASAGAPRARAEVLEAVQDVVRKMVALGLSRLTRMTAERLRTLAVSAHGVDLPRLERLSRSLADEVELALSRSVQADSSALIARASLVEALGHALRTHPSPLLIGEHRSAYDSVGDIELTGLGARRWKTRSGYEGLTVYFWDQSANRWASWTDSRPLTTGGLDPSTRYHEAGPWEGLASPWAASRNRFRVTGAYRNRFGRLSGRPSSRGFVLSPTDPATVPGRVGRWSDLVEKARVLFGGGFRDRAEQDELVLLSPSQWGPAEFDPVRQQLARLVLDADDRPLPMVLRHSPENSEAVDILEAHDPSATSLVLGILRLDAGRLAVEPVALHTDKGIINLTLDTPKHQSSSRPPRAKPATDLEDDAPDEFVEDAPPAPSATRLGTLLDTLSAHLETIAQGGPATFRALDDLAALTDRAESLGLSTCSRAVDRVAGHLKCLRRGEPVDEGRAARDLLRAYHVLRLASAQESVASATAWLTAQSSSESSPSPSPG